VDGRRVVVGSPLLLSLTLPSLRRSSYDGDHTVTQVTSETVTETESTAPEPVVVAVVDASDDSPESGALDLAVTVGSLSARVDALEMQGNSSPAVAAEIAAEVAAEVAEDVATEVAEEVAEPVAEEVAEDVAEPVAEETATDVIEEEADDEPHREHLLHRRIRFFGRD